MNTRSRVTIQEIIEAYQRTGSVWKAGKELGLAGQTVHERLRAINHPLSLRPWSEEERAEAISLTTSGVPLGEIAQRLGRTYAAVASQLSLAGARSGQRREKRIPRAAGYDKASVKRYIKELDGYHGPITRYARSSGLNVELLVKAIQKYDEGWWQLYVASRSDIPKRTCPYCSTDFIPANGKQTYCDRKCAADARADRNYFGGNRRATIGLAEGVCQLCGRHADRGLSSHHVLGKENDPDNEVLIALCAGCHKAVTFLASRKFVDDPAAWQSLISLAWLRRHGEDIRSGAVLDGQALYVEVSIELEDEDDD